MFTLANSLHRLAIEMGVKFYFETPVNQIIVEKNVAKGVQVNQQKKYADLVVSNADISFTYNKLLPNTKKPKLYLNQEKSTSALVFYWGIKKQFNQLQLHNIFFSSNYQNEFIQLSNGEVCNDPTVYLYISSKENKEDAPAGCQNWFTMINVPFNQNQNWAEITERTRQNIIKKLSAIIGEDISQYIEVEQVLDPILLEQKTSSFNGALYGNSSNNMFSAFLRHPNKRSAIKNLYFASGSGHPGGGIPLCILSSKIVTQHIKNDFFKQ